MGVAQEALLVVPRSLGGLTPLAGVSCPRSPPGLLGPPKERGTMDTH